MNTGTNSGSVMVYAYWKSGEVFNSKEQEFEFESFLAKYEALERQIRFFCLKKGIYEDVYITYEHNEQNQTHPKLVVWISNRLTLDREKAETLAKSFDDLFKDYVGLGFEVESHTDVIYIRLNRSNNK